MYLLYCWLHRPSCCSIYYRSEDPHVCKSYREALEREGVESQMDEYLYHE